MMMLRRGLLAQMAGNAQHFIEGSYTLDADSASITLPVTPLSFTPKMLVIRLREMPSTQASYRTFLGVYFVGDTIGLSNPESAVFRCYVWDGYYGHTSGGRMILPSASSVTVSASEITLPARSGSMPWQAGTYDYMIAG